MYCMAIVTDASVSDEGVLRVRTLLDEDWTEIASAKKLAEHDVMSVLDAEELDCPAETLSSITEFSRACSEAWNDNLRKFNLEYSRDDEGEIDTIFIPISSDLTDNFVVWESENNDQQFCEDEVNSMFVDTVTDRSSVYKSRNLIWSIADTFDKRHKSDPFDGPELGPFKSTISGTFVFISLMISYYCVIQYLGIFRTFSVFALCVVAILPAIFILRPLAILTLSSATLCIRGIYNFFVSVLYCLLQEPKLEKETSIVK